MVSLKQWDDGSVSFHLKETKAMPAEADKSLVGATHRVLIEHFSEFCGRPHGGFIVRNDRFAAMASPSMIPETTTAAFRIDPAMDATLFLERTRAVFAQHDLPNLVICREDTDGDVEDAAERSGMHPLSDPLPHMVRTQPIRGVDTRGISIVTTEAGVEEWARVVGAAFGEDYPFDARILDMTPLSRIVQHDRLRLLVAKTGSKMVAGAMLYVRDGYGYISDVGTLPEFRNQGAASSLVATATNFAFDEGANATFLFAAHNADRVWGNLGYRTVSHIRHQMSL